MQRSNSPGPISGKTAGGASPFDRLACPPARLVHRVPCRSSGGRGSRRVAAGIAPRERRACPTIVGTLGPKGRRTGGAEVALPFGNSIAASAIRSLCNEGPPSRRPSRRASNSRARRSTRRRDGGRGGQNITVEAQASWEALVGRVARIVRWGVGDREEVLSRSSAGGCILGLASSIQPRRRSGRGTGACDAWRDSRAWRRYRRPMNGRGSSGVSSGPR